MSLQIDVKNRREVMPGDHTPTGPVGFISWGRLQDVFRHSGELAPGEEVVLVTAGAEGLAYMVRRHPS